MFGRITEMKKRVKISVSFVRIELIGNLILAKYFENGIIWNTEFEIRTQKFKILQNIRRWKKE